jgi:hypothetical protein
MTATSGDHEAATVVGTASPTTPAADAMVSLIQTTIGTSLGPLVGQLDAQRQTIERQADTIREQAEAIGELRAQNRALLASGGPQALEATADDTRLGRLRIWAPWLPGLLAIVAVAVLLTVPR